ncbi:TonB-dependent receptor domain-containing protein [Polynucleobacter sinensis]|jgi:vitamin B12 transporter|uniref:TonB-dependent receptor domain-containing protein n=1 Tax=Polynucleobacter sinensis TaxID=1743157 RepID=UPI0007855D9F|nr:TonB-dependent receptor [Polynucleobacter sinensis]
MKKQFSNKTLVALICGTALTLHAVAQNNSSVSVINQSTPMTPVIVTATRTPTEAKDVLADFTYIGREEIEQAAQTSLPELLQQQRGIQVSNTGGAGNVSSIYIRGTNNNQSLVLIDGVRVESSALGGPIWNSIPLSSIDHIEIIYGPQSTFYGADAMGGVIQIFTKKGGGATTLDASAGYGTYGTSITNASASGTIEGANRTAYALGVSQENSLGFNSVASNNGCSPQNPTRTCAFPTVNNGFTRLGANGQISQEWAQGQELGLKLLATRVNWQYPSDAYYDSAYVATSAPTQNNQVNNLLVASIYSKNQINQYWQSIVQLANSTSSGQNLTGFSNDKIDTPENTYTWQNNFAIGSDTLQLLAERRDQYVNASNSPTGTGGGCGYGIPCAVNQSRTTDSFAASYQLKRGNNLANASIRNDSITSYGSKVTGSVAYGYFFTKQWRANINYGTGFRAPTFNELYYPGSGNPTLAPETNRNVEAGLHHENQVYDLHLIAYQNNIQNLIQWQPTTADPYGLWAPANYGLVQIRGVSLGGNARLGKFILKASADSLSAIDQKTNLDLPNRARQVGNIGLEYNHNKVQIGSNITLSGQRYGSPASSSNTQWMAPYALVNLYSSYEFDPRWTIFARWNNMFNSNYQLAYGSNTPGSNVFAGIRYAMK